MANIFAALAQCKNGWCRAVCNKNNECNYVKVLSRNYPSVIFLNRKKTFFLNSKNTFESKEQADCQTYKFRLLEISGKPFKDTWKQALPGSIGEDLIETACNM